MHTSHITFCFQNYWVRLGSQFAIYLIGMIKIARTIWRGHFWLVFLFRWVVWRLQCTRKWRPFWFGFVWTNEGLVSYHEAYLSCREHGEDGEMKVKEQARETIADQTFFPTIWYRYDGNNNDKDDDKIEQTLSFPSKKYDAANNNDGGTCTSMVNTTSVRLPGGLHGFLPTAIVYLATLATTVSFQQYYY